eukprot:TRINITY_DN15697_c0_g1_i2.p1 TRINITY_DN15697_c0_g1~~TRINITY_DN15697_c0_g1_i2.p1  ORF type:complete len:881 (+),score=139.22 TRINITY_DN15697_c0_g1_i2:97-2739(+)
MPKDRAHSHHSDAALDAVSNVSEHHPVLSVANTPHDDKVSIQSRASTAEAAEPEECVYDSARTVGVVHGLKYVLLAAMCSACLNMVTPGFDGMLYTPTSAVMAALGYTRVADALAAEARYKLCHREATLMHLAGTAENLTAEDRTALKALEGDTDAALFMWRRYDGGGNGVDGAWIDRTLRNPASYEAGSVDGLVQGVEGALLGATAGLKRVMLPLLKGVRSVDHYHSTDLLLRETAWHAHTAPFLSNEQAEASRALIEANLQLLVIMSDTYPELEDVARLLRARATADPAVTGSANRQSRLPDEVLEHLSDGVSETRTAALQAIADADRTKQEEVALWLALMVVVLVFAGFAGLEMHHHHLTHTYQEQLLAGFQDADETARLIQEYQGQIERCCRKPDAGADGAAAVDMGLESYFMRCVEALTILHPFIPKWIFASGQTAQGAGALLDKMCNVVLGADTLFDERGHAGMLSKDLLQKNQFIQKFQEKVAAKRDQMQDHSPPRSRGSVMTAGMISGDAAESLPSPSPSQENVARLLSASVRSDSSSKSTTSRKSSSSKKSDTSSRSQTAGTVRGFDEGFGVQDRERMTDLNLHENKIRMSFNAAPMVLFDVSSFGALPEDHGRAPVNVAERFLQSFLQRLFNEVERRQSGSIIDLTPLNVLAVFRKASSAALAALCIIDAVPQLQADVGMAPAPLSISAALSNGRYASGLVSTGISKTFMFVGRQRLLLERLGRANRCIGTSLVTGATTLRHLKGTTDLRWRACGLVEQEPIMKSGAKESTSVMYKLFRAEKDKAPDAEANPQRERQEKQMRDDFENILKNVTKERTDPSIVIGQLEAYLRKYEDDGSGRQTAQNSETDYLMEVLKGLAARRVSSTETAS